MTSKIIKFFKWYLIFLFLLFLGWGITWALSQFIAKEHFTFVAWIFGLPYGLLIGNFFWHAFVSLCDIFNVEI